MSDYIKKNLFIPYRLITIIAVFSSLLFVLLGVIRFFQIDLFLNILPETTRELLDDSPIWVNYFYLLIVLINLLSAVLLLNRRMLSVMVSQYSAAGMIIFLTHHFFTTVGIHLYEAIELLFTSMFYFILAWFATYARRKGYLLKISKEITTVSLKIQEGCDHEFTYSLTPFRKGNSRSDTLENIIANAKDMADQGINDIVLVGDNVGDFGTGENGDLKHSHSFFDLIKELDKIGDIHRFYFSSIITPMISDKTLNFIKDSQRFSPYFSIKMNSGSDTMLKKMEHPFPLKPYEDLFLNIKKIISEAYIVVEIIVGFPGETDELFNETVQFLSEADISYITTIIYTDKKGTEASRMKKESVPLAIRKKRNKVLLELSKKKLHAFYENQLGIERKVLFENKRRGNWIYGYTYNHVKVKATWNPELCNTLHEVKLTGVKGSTMLFKFLENNSVKAQDKPSMI
jgi:MiaB/RimO family radical SAM methylthiotransferase